MSGAATAKRIYIVALDPSADKLGAGLLQALQEQSPNIILAGTGGSAMDAMGVSSVVDLSQMTTFGVLDGLKALPQLGRKILELSAEIATFQPDYVVLIDNWSFTHRLAKSLRRQIPWVKLVKYVAPQVFASRPRRAKDAADTYDLLLALYGFEAPYFTAHGLRTQVVGNPVLYSNSAGNGVAFRKRYALGDAPVLCVLFGSRASEFNHLRGIFLSAISDVRKLIPDLQIIAPLANNIATLVRVEAAREPRLMDMILVDENERADALAASTAALSCSGSVTWEIAKAHVPMVIAYKVDWLTEKYLRLFMRSKYANLINISANMEIIPEFLQENCTAQELAQGLLPLLQDSLARKAQIDRVTEELQRMRGDTKNPSANAAEGILALLA